MAVYDTARERAQKSKADGFFKLFELGSKLFDFCHLIKLMKFLKLNIVVLNIRNRDQRSNRFNEKTNRINRCNYFSAYCINKSRLVSRSVRDGDSYMFRVDDKA